MFIDIDYNRKLDEAKIFIAKPNKTVISGNIKERFGTSLSITLGNIGELNFSIPHYINGEFEVEKNKHVDLIKEKMLFKMVLNKEIEWFIVDKIEEDGDDSEVFNVTAFSLGYALSHKNDLKISEETINCEELLELILSQTDWTIGSIDNVFTQMYRAFESEGNLLDAVLQLGETFGALIIWDTVNKRISLKEIENHGSYKGLKVSYGKLLRSIRKIRDTDEFATRLYIYGNEDLSIHSVNPTGQGYIEDFSFFMYPFERDSERNVLHHSAFMSDNLCHALLDHKEAIENHTPELMSLKEDLAVKNGELVVEESTLSQLQMELEIILGLLDRAKATEDEELIAQRTSERNVKQSEIQQQSLIVGGINNDITVLKGAIDNILNQISKDSFFTQELLNELNYFIIEKVWRDDRYIDVEELYRDGLKRFEDVKIPKVVIETDLDYLLNAVEEEFYRGKLILGDLVEVEYKQMNINFRAKIIKIDYDFDNENAKLTIANTNNLKDDNQKLIDILYKTSSATTILENNKNKWDKVEYVENEVEKMMNSEYDANKQKIIAGVNNTIEIGNRGIIIQNPDFPNEVVIAQSGIIALSKDGGETWKTAIKPDGIIADRLIGKILAGQELIITNNSGSFIIDNEGARFNIDSFIVESSDGTNILEDLGKRVTSAELKITDEAIVTTLMASQAFETTLGDIVDGIVDGTSFTEKALIHEGVPIITDIEGNVELSVDGKHIINYAPNFNSGAWSVSANAIIDSDYMISHTPIASGEVNSIELLLNPNETYFFSCDIEGLGSMSIKEFDSSGVQIGFKQDVYSQAFTTNSNAVKHIVELEATEIGTMTKFSNVSINKGNVKENFVDTLDKIQNPTIYAITDDNQINPAKVMFNNNDGSVSTLGTTITINSLTNEYCGYIVPVLGDSEYVISYSGMAGGTRIFEYSEYPSDILGFTNSIEDFNPPYNLTTGTTTKFLFIGVFGDANMSATLPITYRSWHIEYETFRYYSYPEIQTQRFTLELYGDENEEDRLYWYDEGIMYLSKWEEHSVSSSDTIQFESRNIPLNYVTISLSNIIPDETAVSGTMTGIKHNGLILRDSNQNRMKDEFMFDINLGEKLFINISNDDSGWGNDYTPTLDEIKAYFNGWRMCNSEYGTPYNDPTSTEIKYWYPIGDKDLTGIVQSTVDDEGVQLPPITNSPSLENGVIDRYKFLYEKDSWDYNKINITENVELRKGYNTIYLEGSETNVDYYYTRVRFPNNLGTRANQLNNLLKPVMIQLNQVEQRITPESIVTTITESVEYQNIMDGKANLDDLSGFITDQELAELDQAIAQEIVDAIADLNIESYVTQLELEETSRNITASFSESGGMNILLNSVGYAGFEHWGGEYSGMRPRVVSNDYLNSLGFGSGFHFPPTGNYARIEQRVGVIPDIPYTFSWYINKVGGDTESKIYIQIQDESGNLLDTKFFNYDDEYATDGYETGSMTFTAPSREVIIHIGADDFSDATLTGLMLNIGTQPMRWSLATGEMYNTNVRMDISGIRVSRMEDNVEIGYTQITPDEFAGYYDSNRDGNFEKVFYLKEEETVSKKFKAEEEMTMGTVRIIKVQSTAHTGWAFVPIEEEAE